MQIRHHIAFRSDEHSEFLKYLTENNIKFKDGDILCSLDILSDNLYYSEVTRFAEKYNVISYSDTVFSKKELESAEWLTLRSTWHNGYPMPDGDFGYFHETYDGNRYCPECGCNLYQQDSFKLRKTPSWGKRSFMMLNWVYDELFVSDETKEFLLNSGLSGFHFTDVKNKNGKTILPDVNQLCIDTELQPGLIYPQPRIRNLLICPKCGSKKYHPNGVGIFKFKKSIFEGMPDIVKSEEYFGWGRGADRLIIVKNSFYKTITKNKLDRALEFQPIELV